MIFITYGIPKSASTYAFTLIRDLTGRYVDAHRKKLISVYDLGATSQESYFFEPITSGLTLDDLLRRATGKVGDGDIVLVKVHCGCSRYARDLIRDGQVTAAVSFRHPADCILSLLDAYRKDPGRFKGGRDMETAIDSLRRHTEKFQTWLQKENLYIYFDDLVSRPETVAADIAERIGLSVDVSEIVAYYEADKENNILEFNKGLPNRKDVELDAGTVSRIEDACRPLVDFIEEYKHCATPGAYPGTRRKHVKDGKDLFVDEMPY